MTIYNQYDFEYGKKYVFSFQLNPNEDVEYKEFIGSSYEWGESFKMTGAVIHRNDEYIRVAFCGSEFSLADDDSRYYDWIIGPDYEKNKWSAYTFDYSTITDAKYVSEISYTGGYYGVPIKYLPDNDDDRAFRKIEAEAMATEKSKYVDISVAAILTNECMICLDTIENECRPCDVCKMPFCRECLNDLREKGSRACKDKCPYCRSKFSED